MKKLLLALLVMSLALTSFAAEEPAPTTSGEGKIVESESWDEMSPWRKAATLELAFAVCSGLAAAMPEFMGLIAMITAPAVMSEGPSPSEGMPEVITAGSLVFGLGLYNGYLTEHLSNAEIFLHNMIGWNLILISTEAVHWLTFEEKKESNTGLSFMALPTPVGAVALLNYRF